ncbi:hypothetical protein [Actinotalea sp. K2]|uniref:phosphatase domain-containing protein n=1 Tax=Actinotalea sp. K2 TaxID=2939438 RepID=UPI002018356B|nr:hypothetical protein [Actinotalea sp. K2]MCL3861736.1 hypothetical protein [Actinotalea sp. K2]
MRAASLLHDAGLRILIVSGRENRFSELTQQWLKAWRVPFDRLYFRPDKDYRPDRETKWEIGTQIWKEYTPLVAFDDRDGIINVWQQLGIATIKVGEGGDLGRLANSAPSAAKQVAELLAGEMWT